MPPEPVVLAFDTSAAHCAAALLLPGGRIVQRSEAMQKGQAERLLPLLEEVLAEGGIGWKDVTALGVGVGPGNFTGIRIAVAAARGLALGLGVPAHGVTRFEALALDLPRPLAVVEDARHGDVYLQEFWPEPDAARITELSSLPMETGDVPLVGSAAEPAAALTGGAVLGARYPLAEAIARIAATRGPGVARPAPFYLRAADAAPPADPPPVILDA
ncbi:tRNA (adenosine(37)-N6)-threonylcarbamoyltransferase complex dimerization subunit type 1 TsaB [Aliigemmobacter aestuarii]|uniref:tRNA (Adenosine(37)-N6)-threonylcarbamoyltransferase complex dimerization subunit type 1 TsaB n=1 Tax=Aliigemmobacter aestuarii TaxID=1445661 RepID=A0A4S3MS34_9RHOB|nr:tRNA (adenosine(37)-N6)-threonylcarbamoyltransferase complex dimerization subunit type 1 TsaB [Gemmobacter aestuarii]THD84903.1 tRNA (adenosine(37)-N6)-threonylcarbamoyltransferase complex dimerization subunit type 1 TsaB [Gemmobacter aestuarii]